MTVETSAKSWVRTRRHRVASAGGAHRPATDNSGREYWIAHGDGFRVDGANGRIGFVESTQADPARTDNTLLMIRAGLLGLRVLVVGLSDVNAIVPCAKHIWLRNDVTPRVALKQRIRLFETSPV